MQELLTSSGEVTDRSQLNAHRLHQWWLFETQNASLEPVIGWSVFGILI